MQEKLLVVSDFVDYVLKRHYWQIANNLSYSISMDESITSNQKQPKIQIIYELIFALQQHLDLDQLVRLMLDNDGYELLLSIIDMKHNHKTLEAFTRLQLIYHLLV